MNRKDLIKDLIIELPVKSEIIPRDFDIPLDTGKIITLTGVRRCGKTYLLHYLIQKLLNSGINKKNIVFINFDDERLNLKSEELDLIIQAYNELYPENDPKNTYFFFDEIQNIDNWEKFVKRIYENYSKKIFLTGSNSYFLSSDIATSLRGRNINYEVYPVNFKEYLKFKNIKPDLYGSKNRAKIISAFDNYLFNGGFPETINYDDDLRDKTLQSYFFVMLYKDLIERYDISNPKMLKYFLERLIANISSTTSINKIFNEMKSNGFSVSKDTLYSLTEKAQHIYFSFQLYKFDKSLIKRNSADKKNYIIDNGLVNSITYKFSNDKGKLLENLLFIHLNNKYSGNLFFLKNSYELDFVCMDKDKPVELVQAAYDIKDQKTLKREIKALEKASQSLHCENCKIITGYDTDETISSETKVEIIPAYKYLLEK